MTRIALAATWSALALCMGTCAPTGLDDVQWACTVSSDCGDGARCSDGRCVRVPAGEAAGSCPIDTPGGRVTAALRHDDSGDQLVLRHGAFEQPFKLPAGVKAVRLPACCQNPCCVEGR